MAKRNFYIQLMGVKSFTCNKGIIEEMIHIKSFYSEGINNYHKSVF